MRLDKFLANENIGSRKAVGVLVRSGAVTVNGQAVKKADVQVNPGVRHGLRERRAGALQRAYLYHDEQACGRSDGDAGQPRRNRARPAAARAEKAGAVSAGRLDKDTTGLLILTDDGDYAHRMLAPKSHVMMRYEAALDLPAEAADKARFAAGIRSGEDCFAPALLEISPADPHTVWVEIREGKFHQVKRMFRACGKTVTALRRLSSARCVLTPRWVPVKRAVLSEKEAMLVFEKKPEQFDRKA